MSAAYENPFVTQFYSYFKGVVRGGEGRLILSSRTCQSNRRKARRKEKVEGVLVRWCGCGAQTMLAVLSWQLKTVDILQTEAGQRRRRWRAGAAAAAYKLSNVSLPKIMLSRASHG